MSPQWQQLAVEELRGTLIIIGASDTGKSSLARYIFQRLARSGTPTAYLDADMGQSTLWLPMTLNLATTREERAAHRRNRFAHYFKGARSLVVNLRQMAVYNVEKMSPGALLAFQDGKGLALELGAVEEVARRGGTVSVHTPLSGTERAASIRFGEARWDRQNRQESTPV